jgi:alkylation response protein AidB-like acyl-CoA dehydrogenase
LEALHALHPNVGARVAALAHHALAELMEKARVTRLTRHQHILFRLGEWIAFAESAGALARRAARMAQGKLHEKASLRFDVEALAAASRIFAREAALKVGEEGLRWLAGAAEFNDPEISGFETQIGLPAIHCVQNGLIADMDFIADVLYGRVAKHAKLTA